MKAYRAPLALASIATHAIANNKTRYVAKTVRTVNPIKTSSKEFNTLNEAASRNWDDSIPLNGEVHRDRDDGTGDSSDIVRRRGSLGKATSKDISAAICAPNRPLKIQVFEDSSVLNFEPDMKTCETGRQFIGDTPDGTTHITLSSSIENIWSATVVDHSTGDIFWIWLEDDGTVVSEELSQFDLPEEEEGPEAPGPSDIDLPALGSSARRLHGIDGGQPQTDVISYVEVLVVWTRKAECRRSGKPPDCSPTKHTEGNMRSLIDSAVLETNQSYINSGVHSRLRLVHAYRGDYDEAWAARDGADISSHALEKLTVNDDHIMDDVHDKREEYKADVVHMILDTNTKVCGLGWVGPSRDLMFSISWWRCSVGYYSFGHEICHNMGCKHDRGTQKACGDRDMAYGYRDPHAQFRTVMAYNCVPTQCDHNDGGDCPRIPYYSSDTVRFKGNPTGTWHGDDVAEYLNHVMPQIANYSNSTFSAGVVAWQSTGALRLAILIIAVGLMF